MERSGGEEEGVRLWGGGGLSAPINLPHGEHSDGTELLAHAREVAGGGVCVCVGGGGILPSRDGRIPEDAGNSLQRH